MRLYEEIVTRRTHEETVEIVTRRCRKILTWDNMLAYLSISGRAPFSAMQYAVLASAVRNARQSGGHRAVLSQENVDGDDETSHLHTYKKIRSQMKEYLGGWCLARSSVIYIGGVDLRCTRSPTRVTTEHHGDQRAEHCIRVVYPSEWAKIDVSTPSFYGDVFENPSREDKSFLSIERSPLVRSRAAFVGRACSVWASYGGVPTVSTPGDTLRFPCAAKPLARAPPTFYDSWDFRCCDQGSEESTKWSVDAVHICSWTVGAPASYEQRHSLKMTRHERALYSQLQSPTVELYEQKSPKKLCERSAHLAHLGDSSVRIYPGDICVLLRPPEGSTTDHSCVFVGSPIQHARGYPAERIMWITTKEVEPETYALEFFATANVTDIPTWVRGKHNAPRGGYDFGTCDNQGFLANGERFLIYRFALYIDGFNQFKDLQDTRSVAGCYILPLGLSMENRTGPGATRPITLASSSMNHYDVLHHIIDDVSRAAGTGIHGVDPYGREVRIFLDPVTFYGDYPAVSACCGVLGHNANAFCTHCHVTRRRAPGSAKFLSTSMHHSRRMGFMRTDCRTQSYLNAGLPE